jgi:hypothetical protein
MAWITIVASILGVVAFGWKVLDVYRGYLHIGIAVESDAGGFVSARTQVENRAGWAKKIDNALLLIGPEPEDPIATYNLLLDGRQEATCTNDIAENVIDNANYGAGGRAIIPVTFYYDENIKIGDEFLTYRVPIDASRFTPGTAYSVRFFVWAPRRYHRSTQDIYFAPIAPQQVVPAVIPTANP